MKRFKFQIPHSDSYIYSIVFDNTNQRYYLRPNYTTIEIDHKRTKYHCYTNHKHSFILIDANFDTLSTPHCKYKCKDMDGWISKKMLATMFKILF